MRFNATTRQRIGTHLLHDTSLSLGECDMATRLISDELDLNLSALASWLIIIVVVVVCGSLTRSLDATRFNCVAIADSVLIESRGRTLVVLVGDVGHFDFGV